MKPARGKNPHRTEHDDFFEAIRKDLPCEETAYGAESPMAENMGHMAA
jgi:hypothetical protein